jgi:hypothetical protein
MCLMKLGIAAANHGAIDAEPALIAQGLLGGIHAEAPAWLAAAWR